MTVPDRPAKPTRLASISNLSLKDVSYGEHPFSSSHISQSHDAQLMASTSGKTPAPEEAIEQKVIDTPRGQKIITVIDSGIVHTVNHRNCQTEGDETKQVVATLFYRRKAVNGNAPGETEDEKYGHYISQAAMFDFISVWGDLVVPWKKWASSHRCLEMHEEATVMEITVIMPEMLDLEDLRKHEEIVQFEQKWNINVVLQSNDVLRKHKRLAVFDMDSTLIEQEVIDEIARFVGMEDKISAITARAMNGEIDFTQSLRERVKLLKGVPANVFEVLKPKISFTPGARELCRALKALGYKLAVLSGGFLPLAEWVKQELGLDYAFANQLVVNNEGTELTGELTGFLVNSERKASLLEYISRKEGIALKQTIAVGDGANDLPMMKKAGLGIAFNAKPKVQQEAPCKLNSPTLRDVLYILGLSKGEQEDLLNVDI